jgi:predicted dithiol-disulfide oxidoreductase (DUF899 family)
MTTSRIENHKIVSRDEWLAARKKLLASEKQLTRERDAVAAKRRQLPWVKVEKNYVFDGPNGKVTLADLFGGKSQLIIYHLMFGPDWQEACPSCSFNMDHTDGALVHLAQRDVSFAAISRAPYPKIAAFKKRMGWRFNWVSSNGNDFNRDYHVAFTKEELTKGKVDHGNSRPERSLFRTRSRIGRADCRARRPFGVNSEPEHYRLAFFAGRGDHRTHCGSLAVRSGRLPWFRGDAD